MKSKLLIIFILINYLSFFSQKIFPIGAGLKLECLQQNYYNLNHYEHLLGKPSNLNPVILSTVYFGNPSVFLVKVDASSNFDFKKSGIYNNESIYAKNSISYVSLMLNYPFYKKANSKLKMIYASLGAKRFNSFFNVNKKNNSSIFLEGSTVSSYNLSAEITFSMMHFQPKTVVKSEIPILLTLGYNYQITSPKWTGTMIRNLGDENHKVNLGGFYIQMGFGLWGYTK